jgi:hypothetical protein
MFGPGGGAISGGHFRNEKDCPFELAATPPNAEAINAGGEERNGIFFKI